MLFFSISIPHPLTFREEPGKITIRCLSMFLDTLQSFYSSSDLSGAGKCQVLKLFSAHGFVNPKTDDYAEGRKTFNWKQTYIP